MYCRSMYVRECVRGGQGVEFMMGYPNNGSRDPPGISLFTALADYIITHTKWSYYGAFLSAREHVCVRETSIM